MGVILTYHAIAAGRSPLCLPASTFESHAEVIAETRAPVVTIRELAAALSAGDLSRSTVAITFDDGFASVVESAVPALESRGLTATVFCVAGYLGKTNDWPSSRRGGYRATLATAEALADLVARGFEIGSHGFEHAPLARAKPDVVRKEVADSARVLGEAVGHSVTSFALPYGARPTRPGEGVVNASYAAVCTTTLGRVDRQTDPHGLPRIDAHYVRDPDILRRVLRGELSTRIRARGIAARLRRALVKDYDASTARTNDA